MKDFENQKLDLFKAGDQIDELGGNDIDDEIVQYLLNSMSEIGASPEWLSEDIRNLESSASPEQFLELINAEPPPAQRLPNWLMKLFGISK